MAASKPIEITVNGKPVTAESGVRVPDLLKTMDINPERVVVEWNGEAKTRHESAEIRLSEGDSLEVVRIVAGG